MMNIHKDLPAHEGFSLIEFVVIISIFAIMAGIGLFSFRGFQTDVTVTNLAHDIAITIRNVQVYGTASPSAQSAITGIPRGIAFTPDQNGWRPELQVFDDMDQDGFFTPSVGDVLVDTLRAQSDDRIESIEESNDQITWIPVTSSGFWLTFKRPFPRVESIIPQLVQDVSYVRITVSNNDGSRKKAVVISKSGDIRVEPVP